MSRSLTDRWTGRVFLRSMTKRKLATTAALLPLAIVGLSSGASAAPPAASAWDTAFCSAISSDYNFRGVTQAPHHCVHPFVSVGVGGGWSTTTFVVTPSFDVNGTSLIFDINAGLLIDIPGTIFSVGPRFGWQGGNVSGSTANQPASPTFMYDVKRLWAFYQEALVQVPINLGNSTGSPLMFPYVTASAGIAEVKLQFTGTSGAFQVTDSPTSTGFTGSVGFGIPIYQASPDGALAVFGEARVIKTNSVDVTLPGRFKTDYQSSSVTMGFRYQW
ncbi:MAG: outer membrane beta-barrel protein [Rhizobiales bacterium]|nr:outer membrane beta-barrel protein [Hyphomicrobiales bacterium]